MGRKKKTMHDVVDRFLKSPEFFRTKEGTQHDYRRFLAVMLEDLGEIPLNELRNFHAKQAYENWLVRGTHLANHVLTASVRAWNYAESMEMVERSNPFSHVKRVATKPRKTMWTREQVAQFLEYCYSKFEFRNLGLIIQMAYEWGQRLGDMRTLTWDSLNLEDKRVDIEQSKRGVSVHLPISDDLIAMLTQQKEEFGFQKWVVPHTQPTQGVYQPYTMKYLSTLGRRVLKEAGIPSHLRMSDLRRTATTEMVEAGVALPQIMAVTGHSSPQSLVPYMKNTYNSALHALTARKGNEQ